MHDHHRAHSTSELVRLSDLTDQPTFKVTSTHEASTSLPSSNSFEDVDAMRSTFRERSRSPGPRVGHDGSDHPLSASWWGVEKHAARPWHDSPKKKLIPSEQTEALKNTRKVSNNAIRLLCLSG